ncbi:translocation/assembly module TamB domain-containing protein [Spiribacter vilamensis]|uniref:Translocation and assembly module TamB n=1 Tax=Spiribacter vilamensis TaxID=531306 RepID=A0A4Q8D0Y6_9GAMM|nr:translocation/assembly module TamB domain-containing protein [Spiribacter vilamensis]RZU99006.1 translocation and assembly module TamB [Spiribacter vilamensis]TVO61990.1 hypothetical protein FPL09_07795 [Spiribacter vilamensis]
MPRLCTLILTLIFAIALLGAWLLSTTEGARWLAARAEALLPALQVSVTSGSLWNGVSVADLRWSGDGGEISVDSLALDWSPGCLLRWTVCVDELAVDGVRLDLPAAAPEAGEAQAQANPLETLPDNIPLPVVESPVDVIVERATITGLVVRQGGEPMAAGLSSITLSARLVGQELAVERLDLAGDAGTANLQADVTLADDWPVDARWAVEPAESLTAGEAVAVEGRIEGTAGDLALSGSVSGARSVDFELGLSALASPRRLEARVEASESTLAVDARIDEAIDITGDLRAPALNPFWPGLSGQLTGRFSITGDPLRPSVTASVAAEAIEYAGIGLDSARLEADWVTREGGRVSLQADGLRRDGEALGNVRIALDGRPDDHRLELAANAESASVQLDLAGGLDAAVPAWEGAVRRARVSVDGEQARLVDTPSLSVSPQALRLDGHCWAWQEVRACTEPLIASPESAQLEVNLSALPLAVLEPRLPPGFGLPGSVTGTATLDWQAETGPSARITLVSPASRIEVPQPDSDGPLTLDYDRIVVDADLQPTVARFRVGLASPAIGQGGFAVETDPADAQRPLSGTVWLDGLSLAPLAGALPQLREVEGLLSARGEVNGTLKAPRFRGTVGLREGLVLPSALALPLEEINLSADIDGEVATLEGGFRAGEGEAAIGGQLDWQSGELDGTVDLAGEALDIRVGTLARLTVTPDITLAIDPETLALTGSITIPSAQIEPTGLSAGAIRRSPDAVRVDDNGQPLASAAEEGGRTLETDLRLVLGDEVAFSVRGATGRLDGALRLRQLGTASAEAEGVLNLIDASYEAYGQSLQVRRGRVIFAGPLAQPRLDIEAVREAADIVAGLRVTGPVNDPQVRLFSRPAMAQADILSVLLTGRPPGQGSSPSEEELINSAALSLGVFGGGRLGESLADNLGVKDFQLEASGEGSDAQVSVSGYLTPNLMVRYGVGVFEPENTVSLRYYFTSQLYLEAVSGAESAFDLFYSFDYD